MYVKDVYMYVFCESGDLSAICVYVLKMLHTEIKCFDLQVKTNIYANYVTDMLDLFKCKKPKMLQDLRRISDKTCNGHYRDV